MYAVADRIRGIGRQVVVHTDRFAPGTDDVVWLKGLAGSGYILLTKDGRIRRRPLERFALCAAGIDAFFLGNRQIRGDTIKPKLSFARFHESKGWLLRVRRRFGGASISMDESPF